MSGLLTGGRCFPGCFHWFFAGAFGIDCGARHFAPVRRAKPVATAHAEILPPVGEVHHQQFEASALLYGEVVRAAVRAHQHLASILPKAGKRGLGWSLHEILSGGQL